MIVTLTPYHLSSGLWVWYTEQKRALSIYLRRQALVGAVGEQVLDNVVMVLLSSHVERRESVLALYVDGGIMVDKEFDDLLLTSQGRYVEGGVAFLGCGVDGRSTLEQLLDHLDMAVLGGQMEGVQAVLKQHTSSFRLFQGFIFTIFNVCQGTCR